MKELRERFRKIIFKFSEKPSYLNSKSNPLDRLLDNLIQAVEDYFKQTGKQGGTTTHTRHPDHLRTISKKGVEARNAKRKGVKN